MLMGYKQGKLYCSNADWFSSMEPLKSKIDLIRNSFLLLFSPPPSSSSSLCLLRNETTTKNGWSWEQIARMLGMKWAFLHDSRGNVVVVIVVMERT